MKKTAQVQVASLTMCFLWSGTAKAMPVTLFNEYQVTVATTNVGPAQWQFTYAITNVNQGVPGNPYGFCGFALQIPDSAILMGLTVPSSYGGPPGYWAIHSDPAEHLVQLDGPDPGHHWLLWWAYWSPAVFPPGSAATLSITLSNVSVGSNDAGLFTSWAHYVPDVPYYTILPYGNYTPYMTALVSPMAIGAAPPIPAPGAILLGTFGISVVGWMRRRRTL